MLTHCYDRHGAPGPAYDAAMPASDARTGYAPVNDLHMYYEVHETGRPILLLHGAFMTITWSG
jgi:hypothetical protein